MTPQQAETIYQDARAAEYRKHADNYCPANQRVTVLAGYEALITAVRKEIDTEYALKVLAMHDAEKSVVHQ